MALRMPLAPLRLLGRLRQHTGGSSAAEFALWIAGIGFPVLNVVDLAGYAHQRMQTEQAAQAAIQSAWKLCDTASKLPAVRNCPNLVTTMTTAAQSTSLTTTVTLNASNPVEGYYCVSNGTLTLNGSTATVGANPVKTDAVCSGTLTAPGDYLNVTVTRTYTPLFTAVTVASVLPAAITATAWVRLN